jgi:hypothetical protein
VKCGSKAERDWDCGNKIDRDLDFHINNNNINIIIYYYSLQMDLYPVAVVLQYTKKKHKLTHSLKTIHKTQNYKHNKEYVLHTFKTQTGNLNLTQNLKVEESALRTIWHRPYYTVINWNNTKIQKTVRKMQKLKIQQRFHIHTIKVTLT